MLGIRLILLASACLTTAIGQVEGMIPRWQVEEFAASVGSSLESASKVAAQLRPAEWSAEGAPAAYVDQHAALLNELEQAKLSVAALGREPDRLTYAVDAFLWLERTDSLLGSVAAGVRRYHNTAIADLLDAARNRNTDGMATVKQYMRQLAAHVEQSMKVAHAEAQRCRAELIAPPGR